MQKMELISLYRQSRAEWEVLVAPLKLEQLTQPMGRDEWTIKDVIAHLAWHEREMTIVIRSRALEGSELWNLPLEQRNAAIYAANKNRSLEEVLQEARQAAAELLVLLETLSEDDLVSPAHFAQMPLDWQPWQVFASNMHEHYHEHILQLKTWLE